MRVGSGSGRLNCSKKKMNIRPQTRAVRRFKPTLGHWLNRLMGCKFPDRAWPAPIGIELMWAGSGTSATLNPSRQRWVGNLPQVRQGLSDPTGADLSGKDAYSLGLLAASLA